MAVDKLHKAWAELDQLERHLAERFSYIYQTTNAQKVEIDDMAKGRPPAIHRLLQNYFRRFLPFASQTQSVKTRITLLVRRGLEPPNSPNFWTSVKVTNPGPELLKKSRTAFLDIWIGLGPR